MSSGVRVRIPPSAQLFGDFIQIEKLYSPFRSENKQSGYLLIAFLILGILLYMVLGKLDAFYLIHRANNPFFDQFFRIYTNLGDGIFCVVVFFFLLTRKVRYALDFLIIFLLTGLMVQIGKRMIFPDEIRPLGLLGAEALNIIEGVGLHERNSFPSGHSATGVACFFYLALISNKTWLKNLLIILGVMVGYSRIYLGQHFVEDVLAGILIGVFAVSLWTLISNRISWPGWSEKRIFNRSLAGGS